MSKTKFRNFRKKSRKKSMNMPETGENEYFVLYDRKNGKYAQLVPGRYHYYRWFKRYDPLVVSRYVSFSAAEMERMRMASKLEWADVVVRRVRG